MFIFDRCCRSSAAVTPVKYECDTNNLTGTSARSKILLTEKLTNGALVTPTPELSMTWNPTNQSVSIYFVLYFIIVFWGDAKSFQDFSFAAEWCYSVFFLKMIYRNQKCARPLCNLERVMSDNIFWSILLNVTLRISLYFLWSWLFYVSDGRSPLVKTKRGALEW